MQTKKIISIALTAALVSSVAAVATLTASAVDPLPADFTKANLEGHTMGICGTVNEWGSAGVDIPMTDPDGDGIYVGMTALPNGDSQYKIRLDNDSGWSYNWGAYEEDNDRTFDSQTNCTATVAGESADLILALDTTSNADANVWDVINKTSENATLSAYSIVGSPTGWAAGADIPMYELKEGKYVGIIKGATDSVIDDVGTMGVSFKVRDTQGGTIEWNDTNSWGVYEADHDRTQNSQTNCIVQLGEGVTANIVVEFDTTGEDPAIWPLSYTVVNANTQEIIESKYTGSTASDESSTEEPSTDEPSTDEPSTDEPSVDEPSADEPSADEPSEPSLGDNYETQISDYIFYDNSETQWTTVHAHWWNSDYTKIVDLEGNLWPSAPLDADGNQDFGNAWPGTEMTQIPGTDIWQARVPFGATKIVFNNGMTDDEAAAIDDAAVQAIADGDKSIAALSAAGVAMQTGDLEFDSTANAGQVYKIDLATEPTSARGQWKNKKWTFGAGAWDAYTGLYTSELLNEVTVSGDPSVGDEPTEPSGTNPGGSSTPGGSTGTTPGGSTGTTPGGSTGTTPGGTGTAPQTGDATVPAVFAVIAVAALGVVLVAAKKKERA